MQLTDEVKNKIIKEISDFEDKQYGSLSVADRKKLGAFYTPGVLVVKMIEKFDDIEGTICDPCCGSANLLVGCIIAGADPKKIYGIELDEGQAELCRKRLTKYGVPRGNIICGSALDEETWTKLNKKVESNERKTTK